MNEKSRWIKIGATVAHKRKPTLPMTVDGIKRETKEVVANETGDTRKVMKTFTIGVDCHWLDDRGGYNKGRFHTTELTEYVDRE